MKKLLNGILEFRDKYHTHYIENFAHLALGQFPDTLFIACSDSRVVPNLFASTNPGDLFVVRNIGNMVPPHCLYSNCMATAEAAAIEFSLNNLPIANIIVCGHSECGAMQAIVAGLDKLQDSFLKTWLKHGSSCIDGQDHCLEINPDLAPHNQAAQINILQQIEHLKSYPIVAQKIEEGVLQVHGWYFDIGKGDVYGYEQELNKFMLIDHIEAKRICDRLDCAHHPIGR